MQYVKYLVIFFSILMSISGAVNSGWSSYFLATPFMAYLLYVGYKKSWGWLTASIIFVILCLFVSYTRDSNPFLYPILKGGTVTILQDGYQRTYVSDGSGSFQTSSTTSIGCTGCGEVRVVPLKKGEVYTVIGIHHNNTDMGDAVDVSTEVGRFLHTDFYHGNKEHPVELNKPLQSEWSKTLGYLMMWPVAPIFLVTLFNKGN